MAGIVLPNVLGIPIRIDSSWLLIVALVTWSLAGGYFPINLPGFAPGLYWAMGLVAAVLLFMCVLLHELGHALTARRFGIPVLGITLFIFGGVAQISQDPRRPSIELLVALAGPLVSAVLAAGCFALVQTMPTQTSIQLVGAAIVHYLAIVNSAIILFNLLPGFPLDGGRVARALLWMITGSLRKATRMTSGMGSLLGLGLFGLGIWLIIKGAWVSGMWWIFLGMFLRNAAMASYRSAG